MANMSVSIKGMKKLEAELVRMNNIRWDAVRKKQLAEMLNRARQPGGTPVSTEETRPGGPHGELRQSSGASDDEMGFTKDYAPHVEFGHRTKNGGWVEGQHFLQNNVDIQRQIYRQDLINAIESG